MATGRQNASHANGRFEGTDAGAFADPGSVLSPAAGNRRPWTVARTGPGLYTITLEVGLGLGERKVNLTSRTQDVHLSIGAETATTIAVIARTAVPAAADADVDFDVVRNGG